jgi:hypothetical protein
MPLRFLLLFCRSMFPLRSLMMILIATTADDTAALTRRLTGVCRNGTEGLMMIYGYV